MYYIVPTELHTTVFTNMAARYGEMQAPAVIPRMGSIIGNMLTLSGWLATPPKAAEANRT